MRWLVGASLLALAATAFAEEPRLWVAPVKAACVDDEQLVGLLRREVHGVDVTNGHVPRGARDEVRVSTGDAGLLVRVDSIDGADRVVASEMRVVPASGGCEAQRSMVVIVIARAVTPLQFRTAPPRPERRPAPERRAAPEPQPIDRAPPERPSAPPAPTPPPVAPIPAPAPIAVAPDAPLAIVRPPSPPPWKPSRPVRRSHPVELSLDGNWMFPVDGAPSAGGGALGIGYGWSWVGIGLRAGVGAPSTIGAPGVSTVSVTTRRIPLALEAWIDLPIRRGAFRISLGPELVLWRVHADGLADPDDSLVVQPGAEARVAYRFEIKRFTVGVGLEANVAFVRDELSVRGIGEITRLPIGSFSPFVLIAGRP